MRWSGWSFDKHSHDKIGGSHMTLLFILLFPLAVLIELLKISK